MGTQNCYIDKHLLNKSGEAHWIDSDGGQLFASCRIGPVRERLK